MGRSSRAAKGFLTSVFQYTSQVLIQILLAPIVLKVAGRETLGAYAAIMQTLGFLMLVDIARHAARAYARESDFTEEEALDRILEMFGAELERPTDIGTTTPRSQKGH